ncbi:uncharacterized protein LOC125945405 [Dermacentor silvarum]|uniref:uncharacterized protein LOC125945405 n=1 Tax=Dermacentor silvarum TaxID=543639 RepID=UPI002100AD5A|nr:uncharacterized protein LOC125945405 [Dermacentor silvarum]
MEGQAGIPEDLNSLIPITITADAMLITLPYADADNFYFCHVIIVTAHLLAKVALHMVTARVIRRVKGNTFWVRIVEGIANCHLGVVLLMLLLGLSRHILAHHPCCRNWHGTVVTMTHLLFVEKELPVASAEFIFILFVYMYINHSSNLGFSRYYG